MALEVPLAAAGGYQEPPVDPVTMGMRNDV
jgi:hypothetical protein